MKLVTTIAVAGVLLLGCSSPAPSPLVETSSQPGNVDDATGAPLPGTHPSDELEDPNGDALHVIGKLHAKNEYGVIPSLYMTPDQTFVLWVTDRERVQRLVTKTGYADLVELRDTTTTLAEVEAVQKAVDRIVQESVKGDSIVGPDQSQWPLVVAHVPAHTPQSTIDQIQQQGTPSIRVEVQRS